MGFRLKNPTEALADVLYRNRNRLASLGTFDDDNDRAIVSNIAAEFTADHMIDTQSGWCALHGLPRTECADRHPPVDPASVADELLGLVKDLLSEDDCEFDVHGSCQAHCWFETEPSCPQARAKRLLDLVDPLPVDEA